MPDWPRSVSSTSSAAAIRSSWRCGANPRTPLPPDRAAAVVVRDLPDEATLAAALGERFDAQPTIVTVAEPTAETARALLRAGARAVIGRDAAPADIDVAVAAVERGYIVLADRSIARESVRPKLTPRERDVLDLLARGLSNRNIAQRMSLAENTVKFHVASILAKLDATTRTQAVTTGVRLGYVMV